MDLLKATKDQLYVMAMDENNRLIDRYAAARELSKRKVKRDERKV